MLLQYLKDNYKEGEPIFLQDIYIEEMSDASIRQGMKKLVQSSELIRYEQGIYYIPKKSRLKGATTLASDVVARYKYIARQGHVTGYYAGHTLANKLGLSSQVPVKEEMISNNMAAIVREVELGGRIYVVRKPPVEVNAENYKVLQFLEILKGLDEYCDEYEGARDILANYIKQNNISRKMVSEYIEAFPMKVYKTIFDMRLDYVFA